MVYAAVMGFCLLIPVRKFGGWKRYLTAAAVVFAAFVISMVLVNSQTIVTYATETETYVSWAEEAGYSFAQAFLANPKLVLRLCYEHDALQAEHYHMTMIGAWLGNVDVILDTAVSGGLLVHHEPFASDAPKAGGNNQNPRRSEDLGLGDLPWMCSCHPVFHAAGVDAGQLQDHYRSTGTLLPSHSSCLSYEHQARLGGIDKKPG